MGWPVSASHNRIVLSALAEASRCPSGLNATPYTGPVCPVSGAPIGWPVSASHTRTVASKLAEASRCPSGLNATLLTRPVCPVSGAPIGWPVSASHNRIVLSALAEASRCPSGLTATPKLRSGVAMIVRVVTLFTTALNRAPSSGVGVSDREASSSSKARASPPGRVPASMPWASATSRSPVASRNLPCASLRAVLAWAKPMTAVIPPITAMTATTAVAASTARRTRERFRSTTAWAWASSRAWVSAAARARAASSSASCCCFWASARWFSRCREASR